MLATAEISFDVVTRKCDIPTAEGILTTYYWIIC